MQLRTARLCLDCEEIHDAQQCPICASETFAYITRWVPAPERRETARLRQRPDTNGAVSMGQKVAMGAGIAGALAFGLARWSRRAREHFEAAAGNRQTGELK
jgi:hypothetical protein